MKREMVVWAVINFILIGLYGGPSVALSVDENTVALWLFDEGAGNVAKDSSENGNNGKVVEAEWVSGKFGIALKFDGIGGKVDYIEVPGSASLDISKALTIEAWVNMKNHQNDNIRIVTGYNGAVTAGYSLLLSQTGQVRTYLHVGGWSEMTGQTIIPVGEWTHLAVTFDGKTVKLYINGEVDFEGVLSGKITSRGMDPLYIGRFTEGDPETPDGVIDEVRISNVARNQEEIKEAMDGLAQAPVQPLNKIATTWGSLRSGY